MHSVQYFYKIPLKDKPIKQLHDYSSLLTLPTKLLTRCYTSVILAYLGTFDKITTRSANRHGSSDTAEQENLREYLIICRFVSSTEQPCLQCTTRKSILIKMVSQQVNVNVSNKAFKSQQSRDHWLQFFKEYRLQ